MPADDTRLNHHSTAAKTYLTPAKRGELLKGLQRLDRAKDRADARGGKSAGPRTP